MVKEKYASDRQVRKDVQEFQAKEKKAAERTEMLAEKERVEALRAVSGSKFVSRICKCQF